MLGLEELLRGCCSDKGEGAAGTAFGHEDMISCSSHNMQFSTCRKINLLTEMRGETRGE